MMSVADVIGFFCAGEVGKSWVVLGSLCYGGHKMGTVGADLLGSLGAIYGVVLSSLPSDTQTEMTIARSACIPV